MLSNASQKPWSCAARISRGLGAPRGGSSSKACYGFKARASVQVPKNELESLSTGSLKILLVSGHRPHHLFLW